MPTDREAELLDAMMDAPEDPGPRLVYADLLLERGDERGELIQLHRAAAEVGAKPSSAVRGRQLEWAYLAAIKACGGNVQHFSTEGWLWNLTIPADKLIEHAELLFAIGPIRVLQLTNSPAHMEELAACRYLRWVQHLELVNNEIGPDEVAVLAGSPHLSRLRGLDLRGNPLGARGVAALLEGNFARLRSLSVSFAGLGPSGIVHVETWPQLPTLEMLALVSDDLAGKHIVSTLANARALRELRLSYNDLGDEGAIAIAEATHLDKLTSLSMTGCSIDDAGVAALAAAPHLTKAEWLDLDNNVFGPAGGRALAASTTLPSTCRLGVARNRRLTTGIRNALKKRFKKI